jgi:hypothetical protein
LKLKLSPLPAMFGIFEKKKKEPIKKQLYDIDGQPLMVGDLVISLRYDLGTCKLLEIEHIYQYQSEDVDKTILFF